MYSEEFEINGYKSIQLLGEGGFGATFLVIKLSTNVHRYNSS